MNADKDLNWPDVGPFFRDFNASYNGKVYTIPLDGDFHMVYYRKDLLAKDSVKAPATWDDYLAIAKKYQGKDLNGDGEPDYGSCIAKKKAPELLVDHLDRRGTAPGEGHHEGRVLQHRGYGSAVRQRGLRQRARDVQEHDQIRAAG